MDLKDFDDIRPYTDEELGNILSQLLQNPDFLRFATKAIGAEQLAFLQTNYTRLDSIIGFQELIIKPFLDYVLSHFATSFDAYNVTEEARKESCIFISNHRDIVLDSALLDKILIDNLHQTVEIGIGDNLLIFPWLKDLVRLNKTFIVKRGEVGKELIMQSRHLSQYIHFAITQKHQSIWIAQREGRAKDSDDRTQESVLKMLAMGKDAPFTESLKELNIHPLAISYEYDPCDYLKAQEFQLKRDNPNYKKTQADDLLNMQTGIMGYKGKITYRCANSINEQIDHIAAKETNKNMQATLIAQAIDKAIHSNYQIYDINYAALDLLNNNTQFANHYTNEAKQQFNNYIQQQINKIEIPNKDHDYLQKIMLCIYANPLINHLKTKQ